MENINEKKMNVNMCDPWETMLSVIMLTTNENDISIRREYAMIMLDSLKELTVKDKS